MTGERGWDGAGLDVLEADAFEGTRLRAPGVRLVCFAAEWCPYARRFVPRFKEVGGAAGVSLAIADLTDLETPLWDRFSIEITPSVIGFADHAIAARADGRPGIGVTEPELETIVETMRRAGAAQR